MLHGGGTQNAWQASLCYPRKHAKLLALCVQSQRPVLRTHAAQPYCALRHIAARQLHAESLTLRTVHEQRQICLVCSKTRTAKTKDSLTNFEASSTARSSLISPTKTLPVLPSEPRVMATSARCRYCASLMT